MTYENFPYLSNETLRDFAKFDCDINGLGYNAKRRAGAARAELTKRDAAATFAD